MSLRPQLEKILVEIRAGAKGDSPLLKQLSSLEVVDFIERVETMVGVRFEILDLTEENFANLATLELFIHSLSQRNSA